jgi:putative transposase
MNTITYNIELVCQDETKEKIRQLLAEQQDVVNKMAEIIKDKELNIINIKTVHDACYDIIKKVFPNTLSQVIIKSEQEVIANLKSIKSNKHKTSNMEKKNLSMRLDKRLYNNFTQESISISIEKGKRTELKLKLFDRVMEMFSKYQTYDPLIFMRENRVFLSVPFAIPETVKKDNSTLGVDLGMRRLYVDSDGNCLKSKEYLKHKRRIRYNKRMLQQTGSKSSKRKLKKLRRKERNFSKNYQHIVANEILKTDKSVIVMEDLSKIKTKKNKHHKLNAKSQIPFYGLKQILSYKAPLLGKEVATVNPRYTSQNDCRGFERGVRKGCRYYGVDGVILDADANAACNIALKHNSNHPVSLTAILDGGLNSTGRLCVNQPIVRGSSLLTSPRL